MRTTFEITHRIMGAQNTVLAGGRYDGLAESLGSRIPAPGMGFSIGEDRLVMRVEDAHPGAIGLWWMCSDPEGRGCRNARGVLAAELRWRRGIRPKVVERKLKRALEIANKLNARLALILGEMKSPPELID